MNLKIGDPSWWKKAGTASKQTTARYHGGMLPSCASLRTDIQNRLSWWVALCRTVISFHFLSFPFMSSFHRSDVVGWCAGVMSQGHVNMFMFFLVRGVVRGAVRGIIFAPHTTPHTKNHFSFILTSLVSMYIYWTYQKKVFQVFWLKNLFPRKVGGSLNRSSLKTYQD